MAAGCGVATNELNPGREELKVATRPPLGQVVVDDGGRTLYLFEKDQPDESYCYGACASVWPPVTTAGRPMVEGGPDRTKVTLLRRDDAQPGHLPLGSARQSTDPLRARRGGNRDVEHWEMSMAAQAECQCRMLWSADHRG